MSPDDSDLEARLNSWNLGVSPGARLELLGYMSRCGSSTVPVNRSARAHEFTEIKRAMVLSCIAYTRLNKGSGDPFTYVLFKALPLGSSLLL